MAFSHDGITLFPQFAPIAIQDALNVLRRVFALRYWADTHFGGNNNSQFPSQFLRTGLELGLVFKTGTRIFFFEEPDSNQIPGSIYAWNWNHWLFIGVKNRPTRVFTIYPVNFTSTTSIAK
jgi:hypothetical protein